MVDFEPGRTTTSASPNRLAGAHECEPHARLHAERIEIVEIRDARQHRHRDLERRASSPRRRARDRPRPRPASHAACGSHGTTPSDGQPVKRSIAVTPSSNRRKSPRNLLIRKPRMRARSAGSSTAWVPTMLAITPPRSMSPTSSTGTSAAAAKPILAMSPSRRLISAGLPAPFDQHDVGVARRPREAVEHRRQQVGLAAAGESRARAACRGAVPARSPARRCRSRGLSSTGFMCTLGASRAARACTACARPISPPSAVTAALFDMFCGLNGATFRPRRTQRAREACDQRRLADIRAGALDHHGGRGHEADLLAVQMRGPSAAASPPMNLQ